jgi:nicotinic acid mononucleotide adenylyltransferase
LANLVTLAIAPRPHAEVIDLGQKWRTCTLPDLENPCASTDLRSSALDHAALSQCLPPSILRRLIEEGLYHGRDGH